MLQITIWKMYTTTIYIHFSGTVVFMSGNGWMNEELTVKWLTYVWGSLHFRRRLLAWDAYRCHLTPKVKALCRRFKTDMAVIPGGCTGIIQVQLQTALFIPYLLTYCIYCFMSIDCSMSIYCCNVAIVFHLHDK